MLTDMLYQALHSNIGEYFRIADRPSPTTLRLRAALAREKGAVVPLRVVTSVVPQLRAATALGGLSADAAAAVDARAGNKALLAQRTYTRWGDVEAACELWAKRIAYELAAHGVQRKPGASMPESPD